jgi:general stress protein 26
MTKWTLRDVAEKIRDIDFAMLLTVAPGGAVTGRPMSNNRDVDYDGGSYFFTTEDADSVAHIENHRQVALSYAGSKGLLGKPPAFIAVQGEAELIRDRARFEAHWNKDLERWFAQASTRRGWSCSRSTRDASTIGTGPTRARSWLGDRRFAFKRRRAPPS